MENRPGPRSSMASGHSPYLILHPHFFWVTSLLALPSLVSGAASWDSGLSSRPPHRCPQLISGEAAVLRVLGPCLPPGGVWAQGRGGFMGRATDGPVLGHEGEWARGQVGGWQLPSSTKSLMLELRVITQHQDIVGEDGPSRPGHVIATSSGASPALGTPDRLSPFRGQEAGLSLPLWPEGDRRAGAGGGQGAEDKLRPTALWPADWARTRHLAILQSRGLVPLPCAFCLIKLLPSGA